MNETTSILKMLRSPTVDNRKRAAKAVLQERSDTISELLTILNAWSSAENASTVEADSTPHLAMVLLGEIRAAEAAPILIKYIKVRDAAFDPVASGEKLPLDAFFPALRALIQIGEPSIRYLLDAVAFARDPLTVQLAVVGLTRIGGPEAARFHLSSCHASVRSKQVQGDEAQIATALTLLDEPTTTARLHSEALGDLPKRRS